MAKVIRSTIAPVMWIHAQLIWSLAIVAVLMLAGFAAAVRQLLAMSGGEPASNGELGTLLTEARKLLHIHSSEIDQAASHLHVIVLLDHFLMGDPGSDESARIIGVLKKEMEFCFGRPVSKDVRMNWDESISRALALL